ncbi:MAG: hypothetical protein ABSG11_04870 [Candidatus Korobacteraceae bacterium]
MPTIQSLTLRAQELGRSVDSWNTWIIVMMALTALAAAGLVYVQRKAFQAADDLAEVNGQISNILTGQVADAMNRASGATIKAGEANERAAKNEREAAGLRKEAEAERLARVKIEKQLEWRHLTPEQVKLIRGALPPLPSNLTVVVSHFIGDFEGQEYADEIASALAESGWVSTPKAIFPVESREPDGVWIRLGQLESLPKGIHEYKAALAAALKAASVIPQDRPNLISARGVQPNEIEVLVGVKPRPLAVAQSKSNNPAQ